MTVPPGAPDAGRLALACLLLLLFVVGVVLSPVVIGLLPLLVLGVWWLVDVALVPGFVLRHDAVLLERLSAPYPSYAARA